jgi:hypothetical protein
MPHYIRELHLGQVSSDFAVVGPKTGPRRITDLSKINLFVGPNNSGKSRLLRELAKIPTPSFVPTVGLDPIKQLQDQLVTQIKGLIKGSIADVNGYRNAAISLSPYDHITAGQDCFRALIELAGKLSQTQQNGLRTDYTSGYSGGDSSGLVAPLKQIGTQTSEALTNLLKVIPSRWDFTRVYVPTLRGLRTFDGNPDLYLKRTTKDYFPDGNGPRVETGLDLFQNIRSLLLGTLAERRVVSSFEAFLSQTFFEGKPVALIPREKSDVLFIKIAEEEEQPVYNLGDGIQMIVAITFPIFRAQAENVLLFIEEPELYLHPGLQRTFLNALASFDNVQCFVATHSNHLLDITMDRQDVAIYSVKKELVGDNHLEKKAKSSVELLSSSDTRVLNLLGVRNSSVFLANCTIWVEGITDRRYIRRFLHIYMRKKHGLATDEFNALPFKEDLHFSFVEYGGSNVTHWSFLDSVSDPILVDRLCARLMLVADKDASKAKDSRHAKLAEKLAERFILLPRREIENLLKPETIKAVLIAYGEDDAQFNGFTYEEYSEAALGTFIAEHILKKQQKRKGSYAAESGTITDKILFCDRALEALKDFNDLSPEAAALAEAIYDFIRTQNPK